jgi:hypothetical protein
METLYSLLSVMAALVTAVTLPAAVICVLRRVA